MVLGKGGWYGRRGRGTELKDAREGERVGGLASRPLEVRAPLCVLPTCAMSTPVQSLGESRSATGFRQVVEFPSAFPGGGSLVGTGDAEAGGTQPPRPNDTSQKAVQA